ncbi:Predicted arabinose efflux permease, MFS family [Micromonospora rhizosphaerae]|uniref:Predicted arabinose efflux permease, MFS family n=1 Tax=Micromonospora rhizosphaerae TaxID=568872 RepID=A0A1C6SAA5_9ACTN|nr:MFS transporter [Micromonospora rhizosphaerae]SCL26427.1 Predicted arabinose efflux permease, MFS family [Micromonospora rhizosphaerae]
MTTNKTGRLVGILALTCGMAVGTVYFPQAVSPLVAAGLGVSAGAAAGVVTATQAGYALGIFLLVPLGDRIPHRPLLVTLLAATTVALLGAGLAPGLPALAGASLLAGTAAVAAPITGPLAARLVLAERRGVVSGTLLSGSIAGMLVSRAFGGVVGQSLGWRAPYLLAAALTLTMALMLAWTLPTTTPTSRQTYRSLVAEPLRLLRSQPMLRRSCWYQAAAFAGFSAVWTCVAMLVTGPAYRLDTRVVGLLALVNAATMVCTPIAGRLVDRYGPEAVNQVTLAGVAGSAIVLAVGATGGAGGLIWLTAGLLLLDVAMQSGMVANGVRIYGISSAAGSRLYSAYMTCAYLAGGAGSWLGTRLYAQLGWLGPCLLVAALAVAALVGPAAYRQSNLRRAGRTERPVGVPD